MAKAAARTDLLPGTLDMLILRTLLFGPAHGHGIAKHLQRTTDDILKLEHGSLYPALHRLQKRGWISARWETLPPVKRECKYYRLTPLGRKQLAHEESRWNRVVRAIASVMASSPEEA
jgi:transcriptional regulator